MPTELRVHLKRLMEAMNAGNGHVMVVDDNEDDRFLLRREISMIFHDIPVRMFRNGAELMDCLKAEEQTPAATPRLILLDLHMPGMNGLQILHMLRMSPKYINVPVVIVSGTRDNDEIEAAYQGGAAAFVSKLGSASTPTRTAHA